MRCWGLVLGILITPVTILLSIWSGGGGHGDYFLAQVFHPYSMLLTLLTDDTITWPLIGLAVVQFPLYGFLMDQATKTAHVFWYGFSLLALHVIAAGLCFAGFLPNFS